MTVIEPYCWERHMKQFTGTCVMVIIHIEEESYIMELGKVSKQIANKYTEYAHWVHWIT